MKHVIIILASIGGFFLLFFFGCNQLGRHIYNRTDCERFNIDNIELRTGINIPIIKSVDCEIKDGKKISRFQIDSKKVDIIEYTQKNGFKRIGNFFSSSGKNENTKWEAKLDSSNELTVIIEYLN